MKSAAGGIARVYLPRSRTAPVTDDEGATPAPSGATSAGSAPAAAMTAPSATVPAAAAALDPLLYIE
jgi:hypothetical protein